MIVTLVIYVAMVGTLVAMHPDDAALLGGLGFVGAFGAAVAHLQRLRPWSDAVAWLATLALLGIASGPEPTVANAVPATIVVALLIGALHVGPAGSPGANFGRLSVSWLVLVLIVVGVAWLTVFLAPATIVVQDQQSATGMALRLAVAASGLAGMALVLRWWRGRGAAAEAVGH